MPDFNASRCTRYRYRYGECRRCLDACPHAAITLSDQGARLAPNACRNCALCVSACRTGAWTSSDFKPIELLRSAIQRPASSLACAPSGLAADAIVPCLGAIDAVWLAYMAKRGLPVTLHGADNCASCPHGERGKAMLDLALDAVAQLHQAARGQDGTPSRPWVLPMLAVDARPESMRRRKRLESNTSASRRQLFQRLFRRPSPAGKDGADPSGTAPEAPDRAIRAGPYSVSEQRELLQIVCREDHPVSLRLHEALPAMQLSLQSGCTVCEACFRVCPTGALQIDENPGDWVLTFQTDLCVACEVCLEVCQPRVLDADAAFDGRPDQGSRRLLALGKQRCNRCDRHFASTGPAATCPICRDDELAFDAIFGNG